MRALLSVYTPTYQRPSLLALCQTSVAMQTEPCEHIVIRDEVGVGIAGMYAAIPEHAGEVSGDYVLVLSDDNILVDPDVVAELKGFAEANEWPDVVIWKGQVGESVQPLDWETEPQEQRIDLSCFVVLRPIWQRHAADWGQRYEGDFDFISALWWTGYRFAWWDRVAFRALQIGRGQPE